MLTLRDARPEDAAEVAGVHVRSWQVAYVDPTAWGRGVGRVLMANARSRLSGLGFTEAVLWALTGNDRADRFYRADGWLPDGQRREEDVWGIRVSNIRYRRLLP